MHNDYASMSLTELEREAWRTQNALALALLNKIDEEMDNPDLSELNTYYKEKHR